MGYESKIIVAITSDTFNEVINKKKYHYASVVATFNLSKLDNRFHNEILSKAKPTKCYIYADDGDTQVLSDRYGDPLKELNFKKFLKYCKEEQAKDPYRRLPPVIGLLEGFLAQKNQWGWKKGDYDQIKVLYYGY